jgi:lysophospholipase L1-like esterase
MPSSVPRTAITLGLGVVVALGVGELALRILGLGDPVLYDNRLAYGYRPRPDQTRRRIGGARVHVNALGVRGPDVAPARAPDTTRLLFLGDSVTWGGSYVDDDALFAAIAARRLAAGGRRVEWLDAGVNGWGPENILGFLRETHGFDSSVWIVTGLADDLRREKTHAGEVPYFDAPPWTAWEELLMRGAYAVVTAYKRPKPPEDLRRLADANLARYRDVADEGRAAGARVLLVWHPTTDALASGVDPARERFLGLAAPSGAAALDLGPAYRAAGGHVYLDGMHLDAAGHRVAGDAIGSALAGLVQ